MQDDERACAADLTACDYEAPSWGKAIPLLPSHIPLGDSQESDTVAFERKFIE